MLYGPVWLTIIVTFAIYLRLGLYIHFQLKQLRAVEMSGDWVEHVNRIADTSVTEIHRMELTPPHPYQQHSHADQSGTLRQHTVSVRSNNRDSGASGLVRARSHSTMAAWAYTRYAFLFFIALLVTWVCFFFLHGLSHDLRYIAGPIFDQPPIHNY